MSDLNVDPTVQESAKRSVPSHEDDSRYEVRVRTMAKDLEALQAGGGTLPKTAWSEKREVRSEGDTSTSQQSNLGFWVLVLVGAGVLFFIGFYLLPLLVKK